jgi:glycosyltransferase involved in cell wall biosynthesis
LKIAILGLRSIGGEFSGGVERVVSELSRRFGAAGHEVTVFCRARYVRGSPELGANVRLKILPAVYTKHLESITHSLLAVLLCLRGYDIVHIHATGPALLSFLPRLFGSKVVVTVHGLDWKREKWGRVAKSVLWLGAWAAARFPNRTIVVSKSLQRHYAETSREDRIAYVPNGIVPPSAFDSGEQSVKLPRRGYILFLGRLVPEKGCHVLIEAFKSLRGDHTLVIAGEASHSESYVRSLRSLAEEDPRIIFPGALYGVEKDLALRNASLFVLPSTIEGMAISLLEAMSYGLCCLCSDIEENLEVIDSPESHLTSVGSCSLPGAHSYGFSFAVGDVRDLAAKMRYLLQHPEAAQSVGQRARTRVRIKHDWDVIAARHLEIFRAITASTDSPSLPTPCGKSDQNHR